MKTTLFLICLLFTFNANVVTRTASGNSGENMSSTNDKSEVLPFAVVELFTSEGCSSCPPADALLGEIVQESRKNGQRVFALAFHVDYWDYIGWKDPFASRVFSERQRQYCEAFRSNRIYTPQMIVNGQREFVGSDGSRANAAIQWALAQPARVEVKLQKQKTSPSNELMLSYEVAGLSKEAWLNIALVERGLVNNIKRGENSGRILQHENVVRVFQTVSLKNSRSGLVTIELPNTVKLQNSSIIGYVQDAKTMEVLGAVGLEL